MFHTKFNRNHPPQSKERGYTLIELMIVIAILAIVLTVAVPVYSNYTIRAKIAEGLSLANAAKTTVSATCVENRTLTSLTNSAAGYNFIAGTDSTDYVADIQASGTCTAPILTVTTMNTGHSPDPQITMTGTVAIGSGQVTWKCSSSNTPNYLLPVTCRS
jgi:type IV pilus assembly protein PilA